MAWIEETHEHAAEGVLKEAYDEGRVSGAEAVILRYALKLTRTPRAMRAEDVQTLRDAGLTEAEVFEVAFLTAYFNYTNRVGEGLGVEPE